MNKISESKKLGKSLVFTLMLVVMFSIGTTTALAESGSASPPTPFEVGTSEELTNALAQDGDLVIELTASFEHNARFFIYGRNVTFVLNGYTLSVADVAAQIRYSTVVAVSDGALDFNDGILVNGDSTVNINNDISGNVLVLESSVVTVNGNVGGIISTALSGKVTVNGNVGAILANGNSRVIINGNVNELEQLFDHVTHWSVRAGESATVTVSGNVYGNGVSAGGNARVTITGTATGDVEIQDDATVTIGGQQVEPTPTPTPETPTFTLGSGANLIFIVPDVNADDFERLTFGNRELTRNVEFSAESYNSTRITVFHQFLNELSLATGEHTFTAYFAGTPVNLSFTVTAPTAEPHGVPQTGVTRRMDLPIILASLGLALIGGAVALRGIKAKSGNR